VINGSPEVVCVTIDSKRTPHRDAISIAVSPASTLNVSIGLALRSLVLQILGSNGVEHCRP
jgi:hypothetical protein